MDQSILITGVPHENHIGLTKAGAVYVYRLNNSGNWTNVQKKTHPRPSARDWYGFSVDCLDNNLVANLITGAPYDNYPKDPRDRESVGYSDLGSVDLWNYMILSYPPYPPIGRPD